MYISCYNHLIRVQKAIVEIAIVEISIHKGKDVIDDYCHYIFDLIAHNIWTKMF